MSAPHPLEAGLRQGLQTLALELCDAQVHTLLAYVDWVAKWNKVYNLTAVRDPQEMLTHHLLDSLAVVAPLQRQLAAVGKAAGAAHHGGPGLPAGSLRTCVQRRKRPPVPTMERSAKSSPVWSLGL